jgi:type I restriction enzyme S subunit
VRPRAEWPTMTLRDANVTLIDCDHRTPPPADSGYPYVAIPQLRAGRIDLTDVRRITRDHYIEWTRKAKPSPFDVVLSRRCNPGETAVVPADLEFALGQNLVILRADGTKVHPPFLRWLVSGPEWWDQIGKFLNVGAVFDSLKCADVPNFELKIPPLPEQRAIAHVLGTLDDKIELNRRTNETLEAIARALFKSWFVDFDPVRAKAEGRDPGLPPYVADLFPDRFEDSELGKIPAGWKIERLGDHINTERGLSYKGEGLRDDESDGLPMHNLNSIYEGGGYKYEGIKYYAGDYREKHIVVPGDMIITNTEQGFDHLLIGHAAIVPDRYGPRGLFSHHIFRIRMKPTSPFTPQYLVHLFNHPRWHQLIAGFSNGTTINMLPLDALVMPRIVIPPKPLVAAFSRIAGDMHSRAEASGIESLILAAQRDALLPKLISGEIRLADVERFAPEAA